MRILSLWWSRSASFAKLGLLSTEDGDLSVQHAAGCPLGQGGCDLWIAIGDIEQPAIVEAHASLRILLPDSESRRSWAQRSILLS